DQCRVYERWPSVYSGSVFQNSCGGDSEFSHIESQSGVRKQGRRRILVGQKGLFMPTKTPPTFERAMTRAESYVGHKENRLWLLDKTTAKPSNTTSLSLRPGRASRCSFV